MSKICFVVDNPDFLISHRLQVCKQAKSKFTEVHVICANRPSISILKNLGFHVHVYDVLRGNMNPFKELQHVFSYYFIFKKITPDVVHLITIKPYLYGGIAARASKVPGVVTAVAGLGILFSSVKFKFKAARIVLRPFFKIAFGHRNQVVIFQNDEDKKVLLDKNIIKSEQIRMIRGSGVDISAYPLVEEPNRIPVITFAARLLKDKGVEEFVSASKILKKQGVEAEFWLVGSPDIGNSNSVTEEQLNTWEKQELVKLFGFRKDVPELFSKSNIVTLPSYYGEGLPKVLIEAAACGRAVITTNHPGCRDAIIKGETGILIPIRDGCALADAIKKLIENPNKRKAMGRAGRRLAVEKFTIESVVKGHLGIYAELLNTLKVS